MMKKRIESSMCPKAFRAACALLAVAVPAFAGDLELPEGYVPLDWIESTGGQYIDTGVNAETGLKASIDFAWATFSGTPEWSLLDASTVSSDANKRSRIFMCHMYNGKPFFAYGRK